MFIIALFGIAEIWRQISTNRWMDKDVCVCVCVCVCVYLYTVQYTHTVEYYSAINKNEVLPLVSM